MTPPYDLKDALADFERHQGTDLLRLSGEAVAVNGNMVGALRRYWRDRIVPAMPTRCATCLHFTTCPFAGTLPPEIRLRPTDDDDPPLPCQS